MRLLALLAALLALATPAFAGDVVSQAPTSVAVTIYNDAAVPDPADPDWSGVGLAMITETREVDLPAGESRLVLEGVADGAIPETAAIEGLPGHIVEQNFDYDLLSPGSLIQHSVGQPVQVVRINRKTGRRTLEEATLTSGPDGVVLDVGGRIEALSCSGEAEGLVFSHVPAELTGKAALSTRIVADRPGHYTLRLAYLTVGLAWKASYVARVAPDSRTLDLTGWLTLANHSDTSFVDAPTAVVAGRLARQAVERIEAALAQYRSACWPMGNSHHPIGEALYRIERLPVAVTAYAGRIPAPMAAVSELVVVAEKRETLSELGDYKLYSIDQPTTVAAKQTKQVLFLDKAGVKFDRVYVFKLPGQCFSDGDTDKGPTTTTLRLENKPENGLGEPLPGGMVSLSQALTPGGTPYFIGRPSVRDVPVGEPFELEIGQASDVQASWRVTRLTAFTSKGHQGARATIEATLANAKPVAVTGEIRQERAYASAKITAETMPHGTKAGDPVWRLTVPANGQASVTYTVEYLEE